MATLKGVEPVNNDINKGTAVVNYPVIPSPPPPETTEKPSPSEDSPKPQKPNDEK